MRENYISEKKIDYFELWEKKDSKSKINYRDKKTEIKEFEKKVFAPRTETLYMKERKEEILAIKMMINKLFKTNSVEIQKGEYGSSNERRDQLIYTKKILKAEAETRLLLSY